MTQTVDRRSPSGPVTSRKGSIALAATAVGVTAGATQTGTFAGARVNDVVSLSPRADLDADFNIAWSRVVADDVVVVSFTNVGASTNTGAQTFDIVCQQL